MEVAFNGVVSERLGSRRSNWATRLASSLIEVVLCTFSATGRPGVNARALAVTPAVRSVQQLCFCNGTAIVSSDRASPCLDLPETCGLWGTLYTNFAQEVSQVQKPVRCPW
jgi:hypothetical protein